jgi:hypothetical protein
MTNGSDTTNYFSKNSDFSTYVGMLKGEIGKLDADFQHAEAKGRFYEGVYLNLSKVLFVPLFLMVLN